MVMQKGRGGRGGSREECVGFVLRDEGEPSSRPDGRWHSRQKQVQGERHVASHVMTKVMKGSRRGRVGPDPVRKVSHAHLRSLCFPPPM